MIGISMHSMFPAISRLHELQGLNLLIPIVDQIKYVQSLKENAIDIPSQSAITEGECMVILVCKLRPLVCG